MYSHDLFGDNIIFNINVLYEITLDYFNLGDLYYLFGNKCDIEHKINSIKENYVDAFKYIDYVENGPNNKIKTDTLIGIQEEIKTYIEYVESYLEYLESDFPSIITIALNDFFIEKQDKYLIEYLYSKDLLSNKDYYYILCKNRKYSSPCNWVLLYQNKYNEFIFHDDCIYEAVKYGHADIFEYLLPFYCDIDYDKLISNCDHYNCEKIVYNLYKTNTIDNDLVSKHLKKIAKSGYDNVIRLYISKGGSSYDMFTIAYMAEHGFIDTVDMLLNLQCRIDMDIVLWPLMRNKKEMIDFLINKKNISNDNYLGKIKIPFHIFINCDWNIIEIIYNGSGKMVITELSRAQYDYAKIKKMNMIIFDILLKCVTEPTKIKFDSLISFCLINDLSNKIILINDYLDLDKTELINDCICYDAINTFKYFQRQKNLQLIHKALRLGATKIYNYLISL